MVKPHALATRTTPRPIIVFVLGMARSGTSALARVISMCGGALPSAPAGAIPGDPHGYWEPRAVNLINEKILRRFGSSGLDPTLRLQEEGALDPVERAACVEEIRAFLATLPPAPFVVVKDPRIALLSGMWFEAAHLTGFDVATVIAVRRPTDVVASAAKPSSALPEISNALWLKVNLLAEADTRDVPRVFVDYARLLQDWRREVTRVAVALGIDLNTRDETAIREFLEPKRRHQRHSEPGTDVFGADWIAVVYDVLSAAAHDEPFDHTAIDRVLESYRATERNFRPVFQALRRLDTMNASIRPYIMKMLFKARVIADRRPGTLA